ncbi:conserved hypothetical protein [Vibrio phage 424E50-1]|nr:conserved hypothetical protein [Vibrio phage 424E50-1]
MKTLLEAIQTYPEQFISTLHARANTTPSAVNRMTHETLADSIELGLWENVIDIIQLQNYRKPLEGVVFCLDRYSDIDNNVWHQIVDLFNEEKFV